MSDWQWCVLFDVERFDSFGGIIGSLARAREATVESQKVGSIVGVDRNL
jgi:hypothetical protein